MAFLFALLAGIVCGAGMTISDMVNPARVLNFFDVAGTWDPTLAFVMAGALAVTIPGYRLLFGRGRPLVGERFHLPVLTRVDVPLIGGAAAFGIGWGLSGFCPGPALSALVTLDPQVFAFVIAMTAGVLIAGRLRARPAA